MVCRGEDQPVFLFEIGAQLERLEKVAHILVRRFNALKILRNCG